MITIQSGIIMNDHDAGVPTILQSATAAPLSLRSESLDGGLLPIWKTVPVVLGRLLRPFGAELMHTHQVDKLP